jgi:5-methyltetrahydrofolate--homocysteine methyltransferase
MRVIEEIILPALERVGADYESGEIFLPQMIKSAETAKNAFDVLRRRMSAQGGSISYGRVILATVKDDIHDIGKNIVRIVMENYGYEIIDLGKNVPPETIVKTAKEQGVRMVGLSALMTTTVVNMEKTIALLRSEGVDCVTVVGGAVLNAEYAARIGADRYCKSAMDAVHAANELFRA